MSSSRAASAAGCWCRRGAVRQGVGDPDAAVPQAVSRLRTSATRPRHGREGHRRPAHRDLISRGALAGPIAANTCTAIAARATPTTAPAPAIVIVSASHWRVMRPTDAPSASCTANSRCREAARATSRFETLVQATRSSRIEARRMVADPKAQDTVNAFFNEWLSLEQVADRPKDATLYPQFNDALKAAMAAETQAFVKNVVFDGDGRLDTLLTATLLVAAARGDS